MLTAEEFEANLNFSERSVDITQKSTDTLAPKILIDRRDLGSEAMTPVDVAVRCEVTGDATIDLDTLKIKYGLFDIAKRVLLVREVTWSLEADTMCAGLQ